MTAELGKKAPLLNLLASADRKPVNLEGFKGKKVVVAFVPGAFTGVCTKELCTFRDSIARFNTMNAQVLAVSVDPAFSQKAWADQNKLNFPVLSDYNREAVKAWGVELPNFVGMPGYTTAKRSVFVIDTQGNVAYRWVSDNPSIEPNYDEVAQAVEKAK